MVYGHPSIPSSPNDCASERRPMRCNHHLAPRRSQCCSRICRRPPGELMKMWWTHRKMWWKCDENVVKNRCSKYVQIECVSKSRFSWNLLDEVWIVKFATRCQDWNVGEIVTHTPARDQASETDSEISFDFPSQSSQMRCLSIPEVVVRASSPPAPARFCGFVFHQVWNRAHLQRLDLRLEGDMSCGRFLPNLRAIFVALSSHLRCPWNPWI